jgi:hypothetical protein
LAKSPKDLYTYNKGVQFAIVVFVHNKYISLVNMQELKCFPYVQKGDIPLFIVKHSENIAKFPNDT